MRTRIILAAAAALTALPAVAAAEHSGYRRPQTYFYYYTDSTPYPTRDYSDDRAYDHARVYFRTHGRWPDGRARTEWRRGQRVSLALARNAAVVDWRAARLDAPKAGYQWRAVDGDFLLVGDVSRLIDGVVLSPDAVGFPAQGEAVKAPKPQYVKRLRSPLQPARTQTTEK